jgi:hypothetical protein
LGLVDVADDESRDARRAGAGGRAVRRHTDIPLARSNSCRADHRHPDVVRPTTS